MTIQLAEKRCSKCGETKPVSAFYRAKDRRDGLYSYCKVCHRASSEASKERRRAQIGDERLRELNRITVAVHREVTGNANGKAYERAKRQAIKALRERHRREFEHLLLLARRGELDETG